MSLAFVDKDTYPIRRVRRRRERAHRARRIVGAPRRVSRAGRGLHAADVRQRRRVRRRGHDGRLARARRLVRADRQARAPERGGADRRRARAGERDARRRSRTTCSSAATAASTRARSCARARCSRPASILTRGTPVFDLVNETRLSRRRRTRRSRFPKAPSSCPARAPIKAGWGAEQQLVAPGAGDREVPRREDRSRDGARVLAAMKVSGSLRVPGDKSISHRALIFGALARGRVARHATSSSRPTCTPPPACCARSASPIPRAVARLRRCAASGAAGCRSRDAISIAATAARRRASWPASSPRCR